MQITLLRYGMSDFDWTGSVRACEINHLAGIIDAPPCEVKLLAKNHDYIVCNGLRRSLESAKAMPLPLYKIPLS